MVPATWQIRASPAALRRALVFGPTPGNHLFGRMKKRPPPGFFINAGGLVSLTRRKNDELVRSDALTDGIFSFWLMACEWSRDFNGRFERTISQNFHH
jgi:hypothetical protein